MAESSHTRTRPGSTRIRRARISRPSHNSRFQSRTPSFACRSGRNKNPREDPGGKRSQVTKVESVRHERSRHAGFEQASESLLLGLRPVCGLGAFLIGIGIGISFGFGFGSASDLPPRSSFPCRCAWSGRPGTSGAPTGRTRTDPPTAAARSRGRSGDPRRGSPRPTLPA